MHEEGHLVGNHSYSHKNMSNMPFEAFEKEITDLEALYAEYTGYTMSKLFRPPEGAFTEQTLQNCARLGLTPVFWSFAYADWDNNKQPDPQAAKEKILSNVHNGMVMLLHPTSATNAAILEDVIVTLKNEGYRFGRVDELCVPQTTAAELDYYKEKGMVFSENPNGGKVVALTSTDGPAPEQTPKVLDVLEKYGAKGTLLRHRQEHRRQRGGRPPHSRRRTRNRQPHLYAPAPQRAAATRCWRRRPKQPSFWRAPSIIRRCSSARRAATSAAL